MKDELLALQELIEEITKKYNISYLNAVSFCDSNSWIDIRVNENDTVVDISELGDE